MFKCTQEVQDEAIAFQDLLCLDNVKLLVLPIETWVEVSAETWIYILGSDIAPYDTVFRY